MCLPVGGSEKSHVVVSGCNLLVRTVRKERKIIPYGYSINGSMPVPGTSVVL